MSDIGNDGRICGHCRRKPLHEVLWVNCTALCLNRCILRTQLLELVDPRIVLHRLNKLEHLLKYKLCIADKRDIGTDILAYLGRVDINMQYLRGFSKCHRCGHSSVADSCADKEQQVALVDSGICALYAERAYHSAEKRVVIAERGNAHHCGNDRYLHQLGELVYLLLRVRGKNASAYADKRLFSLRERFDDLFHLKGVALACGLIASYIALFGVYKIHSHLLNVHRHVDKNRTGSACTCDVESLLEHSCNVVCIFEQVAVLDKRLSRACDVSLLENVRAYLVGIDLTCDANYRDRVRICRSDRGYKVCSARSRGSYAHCGPARDTRKAVSRVACISLVAHKNVLYILFAVFEFIIKRAYRRARIAVNGTYALCFQALDHCLAYRHFHKTDLHKQFRVLNQYSTKSLSSQQQNTVFCHF